MHHTLCMDIKSMATIFCAMLQKKSGYSRENTKQEGSLRHIEKEEGRKRKETKANLAY